MLMHKPWAHSQLRQTQLRSAAFWGDVEPVWNRRGAGHRCSPPEVNVACQARRKALVAEGDVDWLADQDYEWPAAQQQASKVLSKPVRLSEACLLEGTAQVATAPGWDNGSSRNSAADSPGLAQLEAAAACARTQEQQHTAASQPSTSQANGSKEYVPGGQRRVRPPSTSVNGHSHGLNGARLPQPHRGNSVGTQAQQTAAVNAQEEYTALSQRVHPPAVSNSSAPGSGAFHPSASGAQATEAAKRLTVQIKACRNWYQLRALLATQHAALNAVHIAAAFSVLSYANPASSLSEKEEASMSQFMDLMLLPAAQRVLHSMGPREAVTVLHALAVIGHAPRPAWLSSFLQHLVVLSPRFNARDAASSIWALSRVAQSMAGAKGWTGVHQAVAQILRPALGPLLGASQAVLADSNQQDLGNLALGSARLHALVPPCDAAARSMWAAWRADLLHASQPRLRGCGPQALANLVHGISQLPGPVPPDTWCCAFTAAAQPLLPACSPHALALLAGATARQGLSRVSGGGAAWAAALLQQVSSRIMEAGCDDVVDVSLALPVLLAGHGHRATILDVQTWLATFEASLQDRFSGMSPRQLALVCLALSRVKASTGLVVSTRTLRSWFAASATAAPGFSAQDLAQSLSAMTVLAVAPPADWLQLMLARTKSSLHNASPGALAVTLWALARLRYHPGWQWVLSYFEATQAAVTAGNQHAQPLTWPDVSMVLGALARLKLRPMHAWAEAVMVSMPALLDQQPWAAPAAASTQQQPVTAADAARAADALATACWAMFRLRMVPGTELLQGLADASQHAMPHLSPARQALLLWSLGKLAAGAAGAACAKPRSSRRRLRLLGFVGCLAKRQARQGPRSSIAKAVRVQTVIQADKKHALGEEAGSEAHRQDHTGAQQAPVWRRRWLTRMSAHTVRKGRGLLRGSESASSHSTSQAGKLQARISSLCGQFVSSSVAGLSMMDARSLGVSVAAVVDAAPWLATHGCCAADVAVWLSAWLVAHTQQLEQLQQQPPPQQAAQGQVLLAAAQPLSKLLSTVTSEPGAPKCPQPCAGPAAHSALQPAVACWAQVACAVAARSVQPNMPLSRPLVSRAAALAQLAAMAGQGHAAAPLLNLLLGQLYADQQARALAVANQQAAVSQAAPKVTATQATRGKAFKAKAGAAQEAAPEHLPWLQPVELLQLGEAVLASREASTRQAASAALDGLGPHSQHVALLAAQLHRCVAEGRLPHQLCMHAEDIVRALLS